MRRTATGLFLALVLATLAPAGSASAVEVNPDWGSISTKATKLKQSCRNYRFEYVVNAPEPGFWDLSVDVVGPNGKVVWFGYLFEGADPARGTSVFRLCRPQATAGRYKLKAVVSNEHSNEVESYRLPTARFRLR